MPGDACTCCSKRRRPKRAGQRGMGPELKGATKSLSDQMVVVDFTCLIMLLWAGKV